MTAVDEEVIEWLEANDITTLDELKDRLDCVDLLSDDVSKAPVSVTSAGDYMVGLNIEGLPSKAVAVDFYEGKPPRLHIYDPWVTVENRPDFKNPGQPTTLALELD
jgi:hypothetical protein